MKCGKSLEESKEDYLEAIYTIRQEYGYVRNAMLVEHMNYAKSSISVAVKILTEQGYVMRDKYDGINLTPKGEEIAKKIYARHQLLQELLEYIGVPPETAAKDACRMEHSISEPTFLKLQEFVKRIKDENHQK